MVMQPVLAVTDATVSSFLPRALLLRASELRLIVLCWKEIRPSGVSIAGIMTMPEPIMGAPFSLVVLKNIFVIITFSKS